MDERSAHVLLRVKDHHGRQVQIKSRRSVPLRALINEYCYHSYVHCSQVRFMYDGERISPDDTVEQLGLEQDSLIEVMLGQTGGMLEPFCEPTLVASRINGAGGGGGDAGGATTIRRSARVLELKNAKQEDAGLLKRHKAPGEGCNDNGWNMLAGLENDLEGLHGRADGVWQFEIEEDEEDGEDYESSPSPKRRARGAGGGRGRGSGRARSAGGVPVAETGMLVRGIGVGRGRGTCHARGSRTESVPGGRRACGFESVRGVRQSETVPGLWKRRTLEQLREQEEDAEQADVWSSFRSGAAPVARTRFFSTQAPRSKLQRPNPVCCICFLQSSYRCLRCSQFFCAVACGNLHQEVCGK